MLLLLLLLVVVHKLLVGLLMVVCFVEETNRPSCHMSTLEPTLEEREHRKAHDI